MGSRKRIAVVLAGCGVFDGAEIHEATLTLLAIDRHGASYQCFAPDMEQHHVVNHLNGKEMNEKRNVLVESARIARGKIKSLSSFSERDFDAIIFPGGFGVAKNLCSFAYDGPACVVNPDVDRAVKAMHKAGKPVGALCISPVLITRILGDTMVTIGNDGDTIEGIIAMGGKHTKTTHGEVVVDKLNKVVTTPCYMLDATISQIAEGADNVVKTILDL